ncbi:hypothetical protein KQI84_06525 [bacterium]|nr:hypothetical protein [bacterium]
MMRNERAIPDLFHERPRWPVWFRVLFPVALALAFYGHTLFLPMSLIDDGLFYERAQKMFAALGSGQFGAFWDLFWTPSDNRFGPGLFLQLLLYHGFGGLDPALLHGIKILFFAVAVGGIMELVRLGRRGPWAGAAAALVFTLLARPSLFPDFQTHFANWQRLHTTDSYFAWVVAWMAVALLHFLRSCGVRRIVWGVVAALCMAIAALTKISAVAHLGGAVVALALIAWRSRSGKRWPAGTLWLAAVLIVVSIPGLMYFKPWATREIYWYDGELSFSWNVISGSIGYASMTFLEAWGPLVFVAIPVAAWQFLRGLLGRTNLRDFEFYAITLGMGSAAFCLLTMWSITLQRYMVIYTPFVAVLAGVFCEDLWRTAVQQVRTRFARPNGTLVLAAAIGAVVLALACVPIILWQRPTLLRHVPMMGVGGVGSAALLGWLLWRKQPRRAAPLLAIVIGLFFGLELIHGICLVAYAHQNAEQYTACEQATSQLLEAGRHLAESEAGPCVLYTNHFEEPWVQTAAFFRTSGIAEKVQFEPFQSQPEMKPEDLFLVFSHENHWGSRVVPPVVAGWVSEPITAEEEMDGVVGLYRGEVWARDMKTSPGMTITGIEFRADVASWPARSEMELSFFDESGLRARTWYRGDLLPRMNTNKTFIRLASPFAVNGDHVRVEAQLRPDSFSPTLLSRYLLNRSHVVAPAVRGDDGELHMMMTLYGTADTAPRYRLESDRVFERSSYVVLAPGSLMEAMLFGGLSPRSPHNRALRPVTFRYRVETWRAMQ